VATVQGAAVSQADKEKLILLLGNTRGVARVDDRMEVSVPEPEAKMHTMVSGDSLSKIAKGLYGERSVPSCSPGGKHSRSIH